MPRHDLTWRQITAGGDGYDGPARPRRRAAASGGAWANPVPGRGGKPRGKTPGKGRGRRPREKARGGRARGGRTAGRAVPARPTAPVVGRPVAPRPPPHAGPTMAAVPFLDLGGARLHHTDTGAGPAVLLVHGWGCDGRDWAGVVGPLARAHRVIVPDLRGHGRSTAPEDGYAPRALAADLAALLRHLDTGPVVAVGHSMGGHVVTALAVEHPALVRSVVTVATGWGGDDPGFLARVRAEQRALCREGRSWAVGFLRRALGPAVPPEARARHERVMAAMDPRVLARCRHGMYLAPDSFGRRSTAAAYLRRRRCPVLAIHTGAEAAAWERALPPPPGSRVELWPGCGHFLPEEQPSQLAAVLAGWVRHVDGPARPGT